MLHATLRRATKKGWVERKAAEDADRVTLKPSGDFNVLSAEDADALVRAARDDSEAALHRVAVGPGLRMGAISALRWRDVDFGRRQVQVGWPTPGDLDRPKSSCVPSGRSPTSAPGARWPRPSLRFTASSDFVLCTELGKPLAADGIRRRFYETLDAAGLGHLRTKEDPVVFHDLRHTFGTLAVRVAPIADVQAWMGHAQVHTTMIYVHTSRSTTRPTGSRELSAATPSARPSSLSTDRIRSSARAPFRPRFTGGTGWLPLGPVLEPNPGASVFPTTRAPHVRPGASRRGCGWLGTLRLGSAGTGPSGGPQWRRQQDH